VVNQYREQAGLIKEQFDEVAARYQERLEELSAEFESEVGHLRDEAEELEEDFRNEVENLEVGIPDLPEGEAPEESDDWMFDSNRAFLEQTQEFQRRQRKI